MTKKRSSEIWSDENQKFFPGKGKIGKVFHGMSNFFSETECLPRLSTPMPIQV